MKAIVNGKLYDTEKSEKILATYIGDSVYAVFRTKNGSIFAIDRFKNRVLDGEKLKKEFDGIPDCAEFYIKIFGTPEEA